MSVARAGTLGATRICPHCKAVVLQSANICPGCQHHLRFNSANAEPQAEGLSAMRIDGSIHHPGRGESCEYCVVISITNEQGEKIARQVVGGELQGNIESAKRVDVQEGGVIVGDVKAGSITVAAGSRMRGHVEFGWEDEKLKVKPGLVSGGS